MHRPVTEMQGNQGRPDGTAKVRASKSHNLFEGAPGVLGPFGRIAQHTISVRRQRVSMLD